MKNMREVEHKRYVTIINKWHERNETLRLVKHERQEISVVQKND